MKFKKVLSIGFVAVLATAQVHAAATSKLVDLLVNHSGIQEVMMKRGMNATKIPSQQSTMFNAYKALGLSHPPSAAKLTKKLKDIKKADPSEAALVDKTLASLSKKSGDVSEDELREAMNAIVRLSMRKGGLGTALTECSKCNNEFVQIIEQDSDEIKKIMRRMPKGQKKFSRYLKKRMKNLGGVPKEKTLAKEDQRMLGAFTELPKNGNRSQKRYAGAVIDYCKNAAGKVELVICSNLWKVPFQGSSNKTLDNLTNVIKLSQKEVQEKGVSQEDAFYNTLVKMAGDDEEMLDEAASIRANNCFFGK